MLDFFFGSPVLNLEQPTFRIKNNSELLATSDALEFQGNGSADFLYGWFISILGQPTFIIYSLCLDVSYFR